MSHLESYSLSRSASESVSVQTSEIHSLDDSLSDSLSLSFSQEESESSVKSLSVSESDFHSFSTSTFESASDYLIAISESLSAMMDSEMGFKQGSIQPKEKEVKSETFEERNSESLAIEILAESEDDDFPNSDDPKPRWGLFDRFRR